MDLSRTIDVVMRIDANARAVHFEDVWRSWGEMAGIADSTDAILTEAGLGPDAAVGLVVRNRPAHVGAILGLLATRRCMVALRPMQPDAELAGELGALRLPAVLADPEDWQRAGVADACREIGSLGLRLPAARGATVSLLPDLAQLRGHGHHQQEPGVAVSILTSGTTGPPKRTPLYYQSLERAISGAHSYSATLAGDPVVPVLRKSVTIVSLPLSHISGFWGVVQAGADGRSVALLERFEPNAWARLVCEHKPVVTNLPPAPMRMVLDAGVPKEWLVSLKAVLTGSARLDPAQADEFTETYGIPTLTMYGATEFAGAVAAWNMRDHRQFWQAKRGSVGRAYTGTSLRVVDSETGEALPAGEIGLLEVRSPQVVGVGEGQWVRTTDLARLDEDGFLWIEGRADDMIIRGGFKVDPRKVETVLLSHPAVRQAAVTGLPDPRLGEVPAAAVVVADDRVDATGLDAWVRQRLAPYEVPVRIAILPELPLTGPLKVNKGALKVLLAEEG